MSFAFPVSMIGLSKRDVLHYLALPGLLYVILFFGGSELVEHYFYGKVGEPTIHLLHLLRGLLSVFFVTLLVLYCISRALRGFRRQMESVCSLLNTANQGLIAFDSRWQILSLNSRAEELLDNIESADFRKWTERICNHLVTHSEFECESPSGHRKLRVAALESKQEGYLLLLQDVTQEKKNEEQWLIAEKMASVGRMAAGLAHEIGTPLNIISGRAELIEAMQTGVCLDCGYRSTCPVEKHIHVIFEQIDRISRIIQQLLSQAREPTVHKTVFSLNNSARNAIEFLKPCMENKNIVLKLDLQDHLPELYGYADQFQQVLINLLTNSMDSTDGRPGMIEVSSKAVNGEVRLSVKDNGCGIPETNLTKIFDPFFTTKEFGKGTGLGLTVTSNIVRSHGGTIDVRSNPDQGTEVTIHLPLKAMETGTRLLQRKLV